MNRAKRGQRELAEDKRLLPLPGSLENRWLWEPDLRPSDTCAGLQVLISVSAAPSGNGHFTGVCESRTLGEDRIPFPKAVKTCASPIVLPLLDPLLHEHIYSLSPELLSFAICLHPRNSEENFSFVSIVSA